MTNTPTRTSTPTRTPIFTPTGTATPLTIGGEVTAFGVARADGRVISSIGVEEHGYQVFVRPSSGFIIFLEAKPGISRLPLGTVTFNSDPTDPNILPDFQIVTSHALGNGSLAVCDDGPLGTAPIGGVPATDPPGFGGSQSVSNAINDLSCRFDVRGSSAQACTRDAFQNDTFVNPTSTVQFCTAAGVGIEIAFPPGDTYLTARVRDIAGQPGFPASIVIRVF